MDCSPPNRMLVNMTSFSHSCVRSYLEFRPPNYVYIFSPEGKAAFNCVLAVFSKCPEISDTFDMTDIQMDGGIDVYCDLVDSEYVCAAIY